MQTVPLTVPSQTEAHGEAWAAYAFLRDIEFGVYPCQRGDGRPELVAGRVDLIVDIAGESFEDSVDVMSSGELISGALFEAAQRAERLIEEKTGEKVDVSRQFRDNLE